jgi:3-hydroxyacyl-CoA dehydrogenase
MAEEFLSKLAVEHPAVRPRVLLLGEAHDVQSVLKVTECAAVMALAYRQPTVSGRLLYEISICSAPGCTDECQQLTLVAAMSFLQVQRDPYILTTGNLTKRLAAALASECCRLAQRVPPSAVQEALQAHLGFSSSPFEIIDTFGTSALLRVLLDPSKPRRDVSLCPTLDALQRMEADGFLGKGVAGSRGGFGEYKENEQFVGLNSHVFGRYVTRRPLAAEMADRVLHAVIIEACAAILDGAATPEHVNIATLAVGFPEESGGALGLADGMGIAALHRSMVTTSQATGCSHLGSPHLLSAMIENNENFSSLSAKTIAAVRAIREMNNSAK